MYIHMNYILILNISFICNNRYIKCTLDGSTAGCEYITGAESIPLPGSTLIHSETRVYSEEEIFYL